MVSGDGDYTQDPFNLATLGYRQPGSSFKMFTLAAALTSGKYGAGLGVRLQAAQHPLRPGRRPQVFVVHNFGNAYSGPTRSSTATADLRQQRLRPGRNDSVGTTATIANSAKAMGIRSPISDEPGDDPRRPHDRRLGARHGPRLRDRARPAVSRSTTRSSATTTQGADRHPLDRRLQAV